MLIRNAHGVGDEPPRIRTHTDNGLDEAGVDQVSRLVARFSSTRELDGVTQIYSSRGARAQQTAAGLCSIASMPSVELNCGFCDPHAAEAEGRTFDDWPATDGQVRLENFSPYLPKVPGAGESYAVGLQRAAQTITEVAVANEGGYVLVVAGALVIQASFWLFLGLPFHATYFKFDHVPAAITEWTVTGWLPGSGHPEAQLNRFNDSRHLLPPADATTAT